MSNLHDPLVSIIIPVYNGSNYLEEAVDSALAQTYDKIEIIVVNDGSTDNDLTKKTALNYGSRINYFEKTNGGVASALNFGIKKMKGDFFSWLSHDDKYVESKIAQQVLFLKQESNRNICYSDFYVINGKSEIISTIHSPWYEKRKAIQTLLKSGYINGCSLLIKKSVFDSVGLFNEDLKYTQDTEMWIRMLNKFQIHKIPEPLMYSRHHENQTSIILNKEHKRELSAMYLSLFKTVPLHQYIAKPRQKTDCVKKSYCYYWLGSVLLHKRHYFSGGILFYRMAAKQASGSFAKSKIICLILFGSVKFVALYLKRLITSMVKSKR